MFELYWGKPLLIVFNGLTETKKISTIEHAQYLLSRKWPVEDQARMKALRAIDEAMECMGSVDTARSAFVQAARTAGFTTTPAHV